MDINHHSFTNTTWELNLTMEDHILHDQLPIDALFWPQHHYPLQIRHQTSPPPSTQPPAGATFDDLFGAQKENHHKMEEEKQKEEEEIHEEPEEELGAMKEMMYKIAAMQPVDVDPATIRKPKRRNVRISDDPQSVAARRRRERISEKIRILQRLVPGGTKMDTASMLDEAIRYVKFLKRQIRQLQSNHQVHHPPSPCIGFGHGGCAGDWAVEPNKAHGSATSTAVEPPGRLSDVGSEGTAPVILLPLNMS